MYRVLYRKWRPKQLSDVIGQPHVTKTLQNELLSERISHAYLFTGSRGTGKTTCAKILAKAINCINLRNAEPCNECKICKGIDDGSVMDIVEIDAASNNGVENIRNLREEASFTPSISKYRVYIIDEVHMLSVGAFNALLKTLEEPPQHVVFILATTEIYKLPLTILSRCQRFDFHRISPRNIANRLVYVANQEGVCLEESAAFLIAKISDGAMRDALSLLDQCIGKVNQNTNLISSKGLDIEQEMLTLTKDAKFVTIDSNIVNETAGLSGSKYVFELLQAILNKDSSECLKIIDSLYNKSKDIIRLCEELIEHFRSLMLIKTTKFNRDLMFVDDNEYEELKSLADNLLLENIIYIIDTLQETVSIMYKGVNKRIELEMAIIKLCTPSLNSSMVSIVERLSSLERILKSKNVDLSSITITKCELDNSPLNQYGDECLQENESEKVKESKQTQIVEKENLLQEKSNVNDQSTNVDNNITKLSKNAEKMKNWPEVLDCLKSHSKMISTAFKDSTAYISGNFVLIDAPNSMAFELLKKSSQREKLRNAIKEVLGNTYKLGPYKKNKLDKSNNDKDYFSELIDSAEKAGVEIINY